LFVPDALTNPAHWQFALKTTIAIMIVYSVYTMLDWPGLLTSIVTVFFVALGSVGETVHKLTLRISGAIIGGLLAGLSIVFVFLTSPTSDSYARSPQWSRCSQVGSPPA